MSVPLLKIDGSKDGSVELPRVFETPIRKDVIVRVYTNMNTHHFQPKGTHPTAGMDVVARTADPPTGQGQSRIARIRTSGGQRQGEAAGVASVRGGRQAHPPKAEHIIHKGINKKERKYALCSAIAATADKSLIVSRGHKVGNIETFPIVISDEIEKISTAKNIIKVLATLGLEDDLDRLKSRKRRTGKVALRGRGKKVGKSVLIVAKDRTELTKACGAVPGVDVCNANELSVLDLAPGASLIRLTIFTKSSLDEIAKIRSPHLEIMEILN